MEMGMGIDLDGLKDRLKEELDEVSFLEKFDISLDDLIGAFEDRIEEKAEELEREFKHAGQYDEIARSFGLGTQDSSEE
jgi:hypothetical protein